MIPLAAMLAFSLMTVPAAAGGADASARLRALSQYHEQLQSRQLALQQAAAPLQHGGDQGLHARLSAILSELPEQVESYAAAQGELGIRNDALARQLAAEAREAAALAPQDQGFPAKVALVRDDLARLLSDATQKYPQLGSGSLSRGGPAPSLPPTAGGNAAKLLQCAAAGFDGAQGCGGTPPANGGGLSGLPSATGPGVTAGPPRGATPSVAGQTAGDQAPLPGSVSSGFLSGGNARLDHAPSGIDRFDGRALGGSSADDVMPSADRMLAAQLKGILGRDAKAINARDYLSRYAALAASRKPAPALLAAWEKEVKDYIQFKGGGGAMRGVQKGLATVVNPSSALGGRPDTAVAEACWQALAKEHPQFAQGCADNPRTAAMMAGAAQSMVDTAKGFASPASIGIMIGTLLATGLASGGVADVIALLLAIGFTAWMVWKIMRDYGPKLVSAVVDLVRSPSGSAESFRKWKESAYYFTTTLVAVVGIYLGANGIASLAGKLSAVTGRTVAEAGASADAVAAAGKIEPVRTGAAAEEAGAAGSEVSAATEALVKKAAAAEPRITAELQRVTEQNGGELVGLNERLKSAKSLGEKISTDMGAKKISAAEASAQIGDTVRYTSVLPEGSFTRGVNATLRDFQAKGYEIVKYKNTFQEGSIYKGINCQIRSPDGQLFELQFHTKASFELKMTMHADYEIYRNPAAPIAQRQAAFDRMQAASARIAQPAGVEHLGTAQPLALRP